MEIKKGSRWVCVEDVVMGGSKQVNYVKGDVYTSEQDGCITNMLGERAHSWTNPECQNFFTPYSKLDRVYTKATDRLAKLHGDCPNDNSVTFFDNCNSSFETGHFEWSEVGEGYYTRNNFTYLSEQAFIEFMGLLPGQETTAPQPHYDNSNGSLFSLAGQLQLNHWEFDILKRLVRCRKKGQFKEDLQKIKDTCDIYLQEYK